MKLNFKLAFKLNSICPIEIEFGIKIWFRIEIDKQMLKINFQLKVDLELKSTVYNLFSYLRSPSVRDN